MKREELISALYGMGFYRYRPTSPRWKAAFFHRKDETTILVLPRTRGIDILLTPLTKEALTAPDGRLSVSTQRPGDTFIEYFYTYSDTNIHDRAFAVAQKFIQGQKIDPAYFKRVGVGTTEFLNMPKPGAFDNTFEEDSVRYAEFTLTSTGKVAYELLAPNDAMTARRLEELKALLRAGTISALSLKLGVCYAEYVAGGFFNFALMDYSVSNAISSCLSHVPADVRAPRDRPALFRGIDEYKELLARGYQKHPRSLRLVCGPQLPSSFQGKYPSWESSEEGYRRYLHAPEEEYVNYAEFINNRTGKVGYELLNPKCENTPLMKAELRELLRRGEISRLSLKRGVCYGEMMDGTNFTVHEIMNYSMAGVIGTLVGHKYFACDMDAREGTLGEGAHRLSGSLRWHTEHVKDKDSGYLTHLRLACAPHLPKDYCFHYIYDFSYDTGGDSDAAPRY